MILRHMASSCLNMKKSKHMEQCHVNNMILDELSLPEPLQTEAHYPKHEA